MALDASAPFFVAGGTVPPGSPSYVERAADRELYDALLAGEFCYVLNSRQMGTSSLAVRTIGRLQAAEVRTAFVGLTRLGATGADPERWYAGLLLELGRALGLRERAMTAVRGAGTRLGSCSRSWRTRSPLHPQPPPHRPMEAVPLHNFRSVATRRGLGSSCSWTRSTPRARSRLRRTTCSPGSGRPGTPARRTPGTGT